MTSSEKKQLQITACKIRIGAIDAVYGAKAGHPGGSLSAAEIYTYLYFKEMNIDPANPKWADRDRFILSKGHSGIAFAPVLVDKGFNDPEQLKTFNLSNSKMGIHLDANKVVGVDDSDNPAEGDWIAQDSQLPRTNLGESRSRENHDEGGNYLNEEFQLRP